MPKLMNRPPKYTKMGKYAVVYFRGRPQYLGLYGSPESKIAYSRFVAELQATPSPAVSQLAEEKYVTVRELTAAFLNDAKENSDPISYGHCRVVILDFLDRLYGDNTPVDSFKPSCLEHISFCSGQVFVHLLSLVLSFVFFSWRNCYAKGFFR